MRAPLATYRLQFNPSFGFRDAKAAAAYLKELGVSDIYASPVFRARSGSMHGYDIVDQNAFNPDLGGEGAFKELMEELKLLDMGWLQDVVSNHMAYDGDNTLLTDVLEKGARSRHINFFDIEWDFPYEGIRGRVLAPFLGRFYGDALEGGEIRLNYGNTGLSVSYYNLKFPLRMESYSNVLGLVLKKLKTRIKREHPEFIKLLGVSYVLKNLEGNGGLNHIDEYYDQVKFVKRMLWELYSENPEVKASFEESLQEFNGKTGQPESFNLLDRLLSEQPFKLSFWKVAAEEINYRRFFNINELITLRAEDYDVFNRTHALIFDMVSKYGVTGLRLDHIDGLYDPLNYLRKLKERTGGVYMAVEKVLGTEEELPAAWPVEGSTGYDFLNKVNGLYCDRSNEARLTRIYSGFTGLKSTFEDLFYEKKKLITEMDMTSDVSNLAQLLKITLKDDRHGSDITLPGLKRAIVEVMALFPVYRTYINREFCSDTDVKIIRQAVSAAIRRNPALLNELMFIEKVLTLKYREYFTEKEKEEWLHFVMRFQQFTGPLMAKGFEDTLLYVYNRLISLNEVGGFPGLFGGTIEAFHLFNKKRAERPYSMNATSTHDTKRGEDARARINVLSEIPDEWERCLKRWSTLNRRKRATAAGHYVPDRNDEYFLYQTLIGALPFERSEYDEFIGRIKSYAVKAVREAKIHTAWLKPDIEYEEGFLNFIESILKDSSENMFLKEFMQFQKKVAWYGMLNSLSQTILKITSPGVPDIYQGSELWDLNLVDPDNRRSVDFKKSLSLLAQVKDCASKMPVGFIADNIKDCEDGRIKLFVIYCGLKVRNENPEVFSTGGYTRLEARGRLKDKVIAFLRDGGNRFSLTIAPRLLTSMIKEREFPVGEKVWGDTEVMLPDGFSFPSVWTDAFTRQTMSFKKTLPVGKALEHFPVALIMGG